MQPVQLPAAAGHMQDPFGPIVQNSISAALPQALSNSVPIDMDVDVPQIVAQGRIQGERACQPHLHASDKFWCTSNRHWVPLAVFGTYLTCGDCHRKCRESNAHRRALV